MNRKQKLLLRNTASLKNTILLGIFLFILLVFILPDANKQILQCAPGTKIIDFLILYSPDQLYQMIATYGTMGRHLYIVVECSADFISFIAIAAFFSSFLIWTSSKIKPRFIKFEYLILIPSIIVLANSFENIGIIWLLSNYPDKYFYLALVTAFFTFTKWISIITCLALITWNLIQIAFIKKSQATLSRNIN